MIVEPLFVDTNILVYAHDTQAREKHQAARELVRMLWARDHLPSISAQVLQEFFVNLVRLGMPDKPARQTVEDYLQWRVVDNDRELFSEALGERERFRVSLWDALILAAAKRSGAEILWSEDLSHGQDYGGLRCINPLLAG